MARAGVSCRIGLLKIRGASAPAIAISAPTERSMPPVAITSVMPVATMTMVATWVRLTLIVNGLRKLGVKTMLYAISASRAISAPYVSPTARNRSGRTSRRAGRGTVVSTLAKRRPFRRRRVRRTLGHRRHDRVFADASVRQLGHVAPIAQDHHPVTALGQFL